MTEVEPTSHSNPSNFFRKYRAPVILSALGVVVLIGGIVGGRQYVKANSVDYYNVVLGGETVGEISSQEQVEKFLADKAAQLDKADTPVRYVLDDNQVAFTSERAYKKHPDDEATLARLSGMLKTHPVGVKIVVNGKEIGVVRDQKTADALFQKVKNKYSPAVTTGKKQEVKVLSASKSGTPAEDKPVRTVTSVSFVEKVSTAEATLAEAKVSDPDELFAKLTEGEPIPRKYTVKEGDCVGCIAAKLNISEQVIYDNNDWIVNDKIKVGEVLDLSESEPPILNVQSVEQVTEVEEIDPPIEYRKNEDMKLGKSKIIREGTPGQQQVTYRLLKKNGSLIEEDKVAAKVLKAPVSTIILKGTKVIKGEGTGKFSWPVVGARITSYLGKRWGRMHKGIDMVGKSSILASDNGVVTWAGYKSGGLGNAIIIDHKNGFKTVYGHMKSVKVKKGQIVEKGDTIGIMGSTGNSTGTHLHFEIYLNGVLKNPTSYL